MKKIILFMHITLDGFVAGQNGEMDWVKIDDDLFEYAANQTERSDTALYGRVTYEMMENYWPTAAQKPNATKHDIEHSMWYNRVNKVVLSKSMKGVRRDRTKIISEDVENEIIELKKGEGKEIIMFGSPGVAHLLITMNLIDELWLFVNPVLLGKGIRLFKGMNQKMDFILTESNVFPAGAIGLHYEKN